MTPAILPPLLALAAGCLAARVLWQGLRTARHAVPRLMAALDREAAGGTEYRVTVKEML